MKKFIPIVAFFLISFIKNNFAQTPNPDCVRLGTGAGIGANASFGYTGYYTTSIGYYSGHFNASGYGNSFLGAYSGYSNSTGDYNLFLGFKSGYYNTAGNYNSFLGANSGYSNTSGGFNTFSGGYSGYTNTTGRYNTFSGYVAGYNSTTGSYNTFTGDHSGKNNTTGNDNSFLGSYSGYNNNGDNNVMLGYKSGYSNTTGTLNTFIGYNSDCSSSTLSNATAIGANASVSASNALVLGNSANVGIGTTAPAYQLQLSKDNAAKAGSSTWTIASDQRLKKDISDFTDGLSVLEKIHPVWFSYNGEAGMPTNKKFVGIIAQEMKEIAPYTVGKFISQDTLGNKTEYLDYDANALFYILVNSVKEQQKSLSQKDSAIASLNARLERLEQMLENNSSNSTSEIQKNSECCEASLEQNFPNPFNQSTTIRYNLNGDIQNAAIIVTSLTGTEVGRYYISTTGSQITIPAYTLAAGTYFYQLITDGKQADVKKMEIIK